MHKICLCAFLLVMTMSANRSLAQNGYTYHQPSGNRVAEGRGTFPHVEQAESPFSSPQIWLAGVVYDGRPHWVAVDAEGSASLLMPGRVVVALGDLPPGMPPIVHSSANGLALIQPPEDAAPLSHPLPVDGGLLYVANNGDVVFGESRLAVNAMLDARPVVSAAGLIAVYTDPTNERYIHGIMGDDIEAASISIMDASVGDLQLVSKIELPGTAVFEGLSPIWADVDGDGEDDLITTVSDDGLGAQVVIMKRNGDIIARGPAIGQSHRWRHQIAWAAMGEDGQMGLVEVLTPHIGGEVGFFTLSESGDELERIASVQGYTSHVIGSRNLDMAVVGDFNGDGQMELVLPTQDRTRIVGLQIQGNTFAELWSLPLDGPLSSNLAAVTLPDGSLALGAGTVYLWLPA
jgi:hypothetical protein